jgi:hypothetical protein
MPHGRRLTKQITLVLITSLTGLSGCGGAAREDEMVEEVVEEPAPPPDDPIEHVVGAPFVGWWVATHPPVVTRRLVPRTQAAASQTSSNRSHGRSAFFGRPFYSSAFGPRTSYSPVSRPGSYGSSGSSFGGHSSTGGVSRGGFGSSGHSAGSSSGS